MQHLIWRRKGGGEVWTIERDGSDFRVVQHLNTRKKHGSSICPFFKSCEPGFVAWDITTLDQLLSQLEWISQ